MSGRTIDLDKKIPIKSEWLNSQYGSLYQKGEGYEISPRDAARLALKDSDNTALLLIWNIIGQDTLKGDNNSLNYLDVIYGYVEDGRIQIGARSYSSILKCIYLSCFNSLEDSQEMLSYLTESNFTNRLSRYLPQEIKVAHKIGAYSTRYQSDCGIIYLSKRNYVLCVMVESDDAKASDIIANLSQKIYSYLSNTKLNQ